MAIPCKSPSSLAGWRLTAPRSIDMLGSMYRFCQSVFATSVALAVVFNLATSPAMSDPVSGSFASSWSVQAAGAAKMRLIAASPSHGRYDAAVEIELAPGAHTYWRQPGEAGVPPVFSFKASENVARTKVLYPAPQRLDEAGFQIFGYRDSVTFPIHVWPKDASKPVRLDLALSYAVCDRICVPAKGHAELVLPQGGKSPEAAAIAAAEALVPVALPTAEIADKIAVRQEVGDPSKPHWSILWKGREPVTDVFPEGPDGWAFETRKTAKNMFSLTAVEMPAGKKAGTIAMRLTFTGPTKSYEATLPLNFGKLER